MTPIDNDLSPPSSPPAFSQPLTLNACAKINLFLNVRGLRDDGFHEVGTVLQSVALADRLTFQIIADAPTPPSLRLTCDNPALQAEIDARPEKNLITRAWRTFWTYANASPQAMRVHVEKRIPMAAGLGGGSADAATTLHALNLLYGRPFALDALQAMARELGADTPFLLTGGAAWADGRGDCVQPLVVAREAPYFKRPILLVKPRDAAMPTAQAYQALRTRGRYVVRDEQPVIQSLRRGDDPLPELLNDFEDVVFQAIPALQDVAGRMRALGLKRPLLCGSGAAMAGFFPPEGICDSEIQAFFPEEAFWRETTRLTPISPAWHDPY